MNGFSFSRLVQTGFFFLCALLTTTMAQAHLKINLASAHGPPPNMESQPTLIQILFPGEAEKMAKILERLPNHVKAWPGMMIIKVGSRWASVSIVFPGNHSSRIIHLGSVVRPYKDWAAKNQIKYALISSQSSTGSPDVYALIGQHEQTLGNPFLQMPRHFHDDGNLKMPTLLELHMPLDGNALINVLSMRATLHNEFSLAGTSGPCGWQPTAGANCTLGPILRRLVTAAYGTPWTPNPEATTPLSLGLELARAYGPKSLRANGCPPVPPKRTTAPASLEQQAWIPLMVALMRMVDLAPKHLPGHPIDTATLLNSYPDLVELALAGIHDPAGLSIIECTLRREILHGETHPLPNTILRSRWYDRATHLITEKMAQRRDASTDNKPEILFFDGASHVTKTLGVGLVDLVERNPKMTAILNALLATRASPTAVAAHEAVLQHLGLLAKNSEIDQTELPSEKARALLRELNLLLFRNNRQMIREIIARLNHAPEGARRFPDPVAPPGTNTLRDGLQFDLHMVLFEQGLLEQALVEHRKQGEYDRTIADIDSAARLGQGLSILTGYHRSAWIDRVIYGAVAKAEKKIMEENRYLRPDGGPLYAPRGKSTGLASFDNYWHRTTIGSAYVLLLHYLERPHSLRALCMHPRLLKKDRASCNPAVDALIATPIPNLNGQIDYRAEGNNPKQIKHITTLLVAYMHLRLETAPRPDESAIRKELKEIAKADFADGLATELAQVLAILQPAKHPFEVLRCVPAEMKPKWVNLKITPNQRSAARAALADPNNGHWTTLADLFDILKGGALPRPPRLGEGSTRDEQICEGIERRYLAVQALLSGVKRPPKNPVRIPYGADGSVAHVGVNAPRAVWMRAMMRQLWPHLARKICPPPYACDHHEFDANKIAVDTINSYNKNRRIKASLRLLAEPRNAQAIGSLGFDPQLGDPASLLKRLEGPPLAEGPRIIQNGTSVHFAPDDSTEDFLARFDMPARLQQLDAQPDATHYLESARTNTITPLPIPITPRASNIDTTAEEVVDGHRSPSGLRMNTVHTGNFTDKSGVNRNVYTGTLTYVVPIALSQLGAAKSDGSKQETERLAATTAQSTPLARPMRTVPMGLTIRNLTRLGDGRYSVFTDSDTNQLLQTPAETRGAMVELGVPDIFRSGSERLEASLENEILNVVLIAEPELAGVTLKPIRVNLITDGKLDEKLPDRLAAALQNSFIETFNQRGLDALTKLLKPFMLDKLAVGDLRVDFRFAADNSCVTLTPTDDCANPTDLVDIKIFEPSVQAAFVLSVQTSNGLTLSVTPRLQLLLTSEGLVLRGSDLSKLSDSALAQFEQHLAAAIEAWLKNAADVRVALRRDLAGREGMSVPARGVQVGLSLIANISNSCEVPLTLELDLEQLGKIDHMLANLLSSSADTLADCAAVAAIDRLDDIVKLKAFLDRSYQLGDTQFAIRYDRQAFDLGLPSNGRVPFALEYDGIEATGLTISLNEGLALPISSGERKALDKLVTKAFAARLTGILGGVIRIDSLVLSQSEPGHPIRVMADMTVENVPFLGDITLPRIDLVAPNKTSLEAALKTTLATKAAAQLHARLPDQMALPFVGNYRRTALTADLSDATRPKLKLEGNLEIIEGLHIPATIRIPLKGSVSDLDIEMDNPTALQQQLKAFSPLKDAFSFGPLEVVNTRIGLVPGKRGRYAVFFDTKLEVDGLFKLGADNLMLDQSGLRLGATISGAIPYPVETSVVALSSIGVTIHTGESGTKSGLVLDTDISALNSTTAALAKITARLDLRDIGNLQFRMDGDVIVLDAVPLLFARGEVALKEQSFDFETGTVPALENIISVYGTGTLNGKAKPPELNANTRLAVLRVKLDESQLRLKIDDPGEVSFQSKTNLLIAKGGMQFKSGLDLSEIDLEGNMHLDLFGWSPGRAMIKINTQRANAQIKVLFARLGITVRHADLFDPEVIIDMLMSLFDISLKDLLNVRLNELQVAAGSISADGSTGRDGQPSNGQDQADGKGSSDNDSDDANGTPQSQPRDIPAPDPETGQVDSDDGHPANEGGMLRGGTRYCDPTLRQNDGTLRYRLYVSSHKLGNKEKTFPSHPHPGNIRYHRETFRWTGNDPMSSLCTGSHGQPFPTEVRDWIPRLTTRLYRGNILNCIGRLNLPIPPDITGDFTLETSEDESLGFPFVHAKSPFLCWELADGTNTFAYAQIFEHQQNNTLRALIFCKGPEQVTAFKNKDNHSLYKEICVDGPMSREFDPNTVKDAVISIKEKDGVSRIVKPTAEQALIENLRATLLNEPTPLTSTFTLANGVEARARSHAQAGAIQWSKVSFITLSSGRNRHGFVVDETLAGILHNNATQQLPERLLQAWYDRGTRSASGHPKLVYKPANDSTGPLLWLQSYGTNPKLEDLDWILASDTNQAVRPAVKLTLSNTGNGPKPTVGGANFKPYVQLAHTLLERATLQWPDQRQFEVILSDYDNEQNRRYIALRPQGASSTEDGLLIAALIPADKRATAELSTYSFAPSSTVGTAELLTHAQLRCRIKLAHDQSSLSPLPDAQAAALDPWSIFGQPSQQRQALNLANDPILAMFIEPSTTTECRDTTE